MIENPTVCDEIGEKIPIAVSEHQGPGEIGSGFRWFRAQDVKPAAFSPRRCSEWPGANNLGERGLGLNPTLSFHPGSARAVRAEPYRMGSKSHPESVFGGHTELTELFASFLPDFGFESTDFPLFIDHETGHRFQPNT